MRNVLFKGLLLLYYHPPLTMRRCGLGFLEQNCMLLYLLCCSQKLLEEDEEAVEEKKKTKKKKRFKRESVK